MSDDPNASTSESVNDIVLLAGAGASSYLGLPTLDDLLRQAILGNDEIADRIRHTRDAIEGSRDRFVTAVFEELIVKLHDYLEFAKVLRKDNTFRRELGLIPPDVDTGVFERKWMEALTRCYRVLLDVYGPNKFETTSKEFQTTLNLLEKIAKTNSNELHIYTTNYDCSYQILASNCKNLSFFTHIDSKSGVFTEYWHCVNPNVEISDLPLIYVHRLHGCVAWFTVTPRSREIEAADSRIEEAYGAGSGLQIIDDDYLHRMSVKLVAPQPVGTNRALVLAFEEFSSHLKTAKVLLIWGYGFRDMDVLSIINQAFSLRKAPLVIYYLDPFLNEERAINRIRWTLREALIEVSPEFRPKRINWMPGDGHDKLISSIMEAFKGV
jgi:hypothetical protein